ncbi:glycosyltransferase family 2 protein [Haloimpatiens lingqiaonensis]|uniref:glycosyltransferase family 2 protein n=1 Tax=Haloimpatiens lingqiaonensis TaxID=1380675 RepID=UPI0010FE2E64|nr:glycosyltransferase family A protein [Haloimpatiens lingqiaonensis]
MGEPLVSIITPCYNGEKYVQRFLESVLNQSYNNIELIFINDGSIDKTEEVVMSYESKFKERNIDFKYIYQENKGQAAALNQGLKIFRGDYLTWPDADDFLATDSIEKRVEFLQNNKEYGLVRSDMNIFNEFDLNKSIGFISGKNSNRFKEHIFVDLIKEHTYCSNGCYMVRTNAFLDVNPNKKIYVSSAGQNWQMLLPVTYKYKCGYIDEPLYNYIVRKDSHSRQEEFKSEILNKTYKHEELLKVVIKEMMIEDENYHLSIIDKKYLRKRLLLAYEYKDKELLEQQYRILKKNKYENIVDNIVYIRGKFKFIDYVFKVMALPIKVKNKVKRLFYD